MLKRVAVASAVVVLALIVAATLLDDRATLAASSSSEPAAGAVDGLDASFSGDGILTRDFFGHHDEARSVTVVADGGILVDAFAGRDNEGGGDGVVLGYRADGSNDASFGRDGVLRSQAAGRVVEQPDGKLLLLGSTRTGVAVGRVSRNGSPDRSFGRSGVSVIGKRALGGADCIGRPGGAALTRAGRIVVTGALGCGGEDGGELGIYVARLRADGRLDRSFGRAGTVISGRACGAAGVAIQRSGRIVIAGDTGSFDYCTGGAMLLTRLRADGSLDRTFGDRGRTLVRFPGGGDSGVGALATDRRGRLHLAGWAGDDLAVARVLPSGRLDRTFSRDGRVMRRTATTADEDDAYGATGIAVSRDGRVTVSAVLETDTPSQNSPANAQAKFALLRFRRNGRADLSFAPGGIRVILFGSDSAFAWDVTLDADGRAVAVGWTLVSEGNSDIAIARVR